MLNHTTIGIDLQRAGIGGYSISIPDLIRKQTPIALSMNLYEWGKAVEIITKLISTSVYPFQIEAGYQYSDHRMGWCITLTLAVTHDGNRTILFHDNGTIHEFTSTPKWQEYADALKAKLDGLVTDIDSAWELAHGLGVGERTGWVAFWAQLYDEQTDNEYMAMALTMPSYKTAKHALNRLGGQWGYRIKLYDLARITRDETGEYHYDRERMTKIVVHWAESYVFSNEQEIDSFHEFNQCVQAIACYRKVKGMDGGYTKVKVTVHFADGGTWGTRVDVEDSYIDYDLRDEMRNNFKFYVDNCDQPEYAWLNLAGKRDELLNDYHRLQDLYGQA